MQTFLEYINRLVLRFVATTEEEKQQGLMHQKPLQPNEAALFVYKTPSTSAFWNKNVSFPIDIGFFDENKQLIDIKQLKENQIQPIKCKSPYVYALETSFNFFNENDIGKSLNDFI
jgi:hypothetical protein